MGGYVRGFRLSRAWECGVTRSGTDLASIEVASPGAVLAAGKSPHHKDGRAKTASRSSCTVESYLCEERQTMTWNARFEAFVARKQAAAAAARLPGYHTVGSHCPAVDLETVGNGWTSALFDGPFFESPPDDPALPAINTVFVQSADLNTGARNPADLGGGATDTHLIYEGLSRIRADAVMTGATTVRGSQMIFGVWHPELVRLRTSLGFPRYPAQVVATLSGRLGIESDLMFNVPEIPVFILTTSTGADALRPRLVGRPWITIIAAPREEHLVGSLRELRAEHGIRRICCVGGRTLATEL